MGYLLGAGILVMAVGGFIGLRYYQARLRRMQLQKKKDGER